MTIIIRDYRPDDLSGLQNVCLRTGFHGGDATGMVDPDLLGLLFAAPYAHFDPQLCLVAADADQVLGYVVGTSDSHRFAQDCDEAWWPELRTRYPQTEPDEDTFEAAMLRRLHAGYHAGEWASRYPAHLHINLLPIAQGRGIGRTLIDGFCAKLEQRRVTGLHFAASARNTGAIAFYDRLGFKCLAEDALSVVFGRTIVSEDPTA